MKKNVPQYIIAPSILSADFACLGEEIAAVVDAGANWIHIDVMDNHYVPNLTVGSMVCSAIKPYAGSALIDVHLMVSPVDDLIHQFAKAGADIIVFHPEATLHLDRSLALVKSYGLKAGLAFNPATSLNYLEYVLDKLDVILLMSVNPGFGGQEFIPSTYDKIVRVRSIIDESKCNVILEVDGGINSSNIAKVAHCGANAFVMGSAIFGAKPSGYANVISQLRGKL